MSRSYRVILKRSRRLFAAVLGGGLIAAFLVAGTGPAKAATWGEPLLVSSSANGTPVPYVSVATEGDDLHLVSTKHRFLNGFLDVRMFYQRSTDNGKSWSDPVRLDRHEALYSPVIAVDGDRVHLIWTKGYGRLIYRTSFDGGQAWGAKRQIGHDVSRPQVLAADGTVHVFFAKQTLSGDTVIRYRSSDDGASWTPAKSLSKKTKYRGPELTVDIADGVLHLARRNTPGYGPEDETIVYKRSVDGGSTWTRGKRIVGPEITVIDRPRIAAEADHVHLVYVHDNALKYLRSADRGKSWTKESEVLQSVADRSWNWELDIDADGRWVSVVFGYMNQGEIGRSFLRSLNRGKVWRPPKIIPGYSPQLFETAVSIAAVGQKVHLLHSVYDVDLTRPQVYWQLFA